MDRTFFSGETENARHDAHGTEGDALGPEREAVMRRAKDLLVAYMPYKVHLHNVTLDLVQSWTEGYWRHPFMRDTWRFVDPGAPGPA